MNKYRFVFQFCFIFIIIGALNWGLVALDPSNDIIKNIFPNLEIIQRVIYTLIGLSGIISTYLLLTYYNDICMVN